MKHVVYTEQFSKNVTASADRKKSNTVSNSRTSCFLCYNLSTQKKIIFCHSGLCSSTVVPCIQSQLVSAWSLVVVHAGLYFAPSVFAHNPVGSESPALLDAAGYCESDSVWNTQKKKKKKIILNSINLIKWQIWMTRRATVWFELFRMDECCPLKDTTWQYNKEKLTSSSLML